MDLIAAICRDYGVRLEHVPRPSEDAAQRIRPRAETGEAEYLIAVDEEGGCLLRIHPGETDVVLSCCLIAEMAAESFSRGETLMDRLSRLYRRYGIPEE